MPYFESNAGPKPVNIYYEDLGGGTKTVVLIHGWPLSGSMWEYQVTTLLENDYRVITYDRRGFGKSGYPAGGYDYVTMAGDLEALLNEVDASDVTLVGFSMGGGEIAKYFSNYGGKRVAKVMLVSSVLPFMLKTDDNPDGVPQDVFDEMAEGVRTDRPTFLESFTKDFYGVSLINKPISDAYLNVAINKAMESSQVATLECAKAFSSTDFRADCPKINVPTLIIHGEKDQTVPIDVAGKKAVELIPGATLKIYDGEPHGLWFTSQKELTQDIMDFAG